MNHATNGVNGSNGSTLAYAPLGTVHDEDGPKKVKRKNTTPKVETPRMSAEDAKKAIGEQINTLRDFHNQLGEYLKMTQQAIAAGDFSSPTVEGADRLLQSFDDVKDSIEKIYDVALERAYSRLPPRRRK